MEVLLAFETEVYCSKSVDILIIFHSGGVFIGIGCDKGVNAFEKVVGIEF
jgi:hypothetical protein